MIDLFCLLVSTGACLLVAIRAVILDRSVPWFAPERPSGTHEAPSTEPTAGDMPRWRARAAATAARTRG